MDQLETFNQGRRRATGTDPADDIPDTVYSPHEIFELGEQMRTGANYEDNKSIVVLPFDKYRVEIKISPDGKFLGINGISLDENFLLFERKKHFRDLFRLDEEFPEEPLK